MGEGQVPDDACDLRITTTNLNYHEFAFLHVAASNTTSESTFPAVAPTYSRPTFQLLKGADISLCKSSAVFGVSM